MLLVQNTDRAEQIRILEKLLEIAVTSYQRIRVLLALISSRFDYNSSAATHMPVELWLSAQREVDQLLSIIASDTNYLVQEVTDDYDELVERSPLTEEGGIVRIRGSIISFIDRLDDEFTKSLQNIDPHGTEYVDRLKDEKVLYCTICRAQAFYEKGGQDEPLSRVIMRRLEHIYSKVCDSLCLKKFQLMVLTAHRCCRGPRSGRRNLGRATPNEPFYAKRSIFPHSLSLHLPLQNWKLSFENTRNAQSHISPCSEQRLLHCA